MRAREQFACAHLCTAPGARGHTPLHPRSHSSGNRHHRSSSTHADGPPRDTQRRPPAQHGPRQCAAPAGCVWQEVRQRAGVCVCVCVCGCCVWGCVEAGNPSPPRTPGTPGSPFASPPHGAPHKRPTHTQGLGAVVTDIHKIQSTDQRLYLHATRHKGGTVVHGGLKIGGKRLFVISVRAHAHCCALHTRHLVACPKSA